MPVTYFWAVDSTGKVFTLANNGKHWKELPYSGVELKRVSAIKSCAWGIGGDHQIYLYIPAGDLPIRCREVTYENQRWNPKEGFCSRLLPTDRPGWSSKDGLTPLPKKGFILPSSSWQWEDEWYIEDNLEGQPLGVEGWTFSVDFPFTYTSDKKWTSMVRRRKWIRHRRYVAIEKWSQIQSVHGDPVAEPFIDVSVGGTDIPGGEPEDVMVWAVTVQGRVMFRQGVSRLSPEGVLWKHIPVPENFEVNQISVGPTGLVWAISWNGHALVRLGVSRENYLGTEWVEVPAPDPKHKLQHVSVGHNIIWAVCRDGTVYFRKGVKGSNLDSRTSVTGTGWVQMIGEMVMVSVGPNDQLWGLSLEDKKIFLRTGVTTVEASGREWKQITVPIGAPLSRASSTGSLASIYMPSTPKMHGTFDYNIPSEVKGQGDSSLTGSPARHAKNPYVRIMEETSGDSGTSSPPLSVSFHVENTKKFSRSNESASSSPYDSDYPSGDESFREDGLHEQTSSIGKRDSVYSDTAQTICDDRMPEEWTCRNFIAESMYIPAGPSWTWVSGSACCVESLSLPPWFSVGSHNSEEVAPWRQTILGLLKNRRKMEMINYSYPQAVEKATWVKTTLGSLWRDSWPCQWTRCQLELEGQSYETNSEAAMLKLHYNHGGLRKLIVNVQEITCIMNISDHRDKHIMCIYTEALNKKETSLKIAYNSDQDLEDWVATLNISACALRDIRGKPENRAIWTTSIQGNIYVHNLHIPDVEKEALSDMLWYLLGGGHLRLIETCPQGITWGLGYDKTVWVYTGGFGGSVFKGITGYNVGINPMTDLRCMYVYENQRWNPISGFAAKGLITDRYMWSDETGRVSMTKESITLPSVHWQWLTDWQVDYKTPGGVDNQGWQYATDFPFTYRPHKGITDYVRRRRWYRLCKLTTSGPWKELESTPLMDVSFQMDHSGNPSDPIAVWGVAGNGDVLCRTDVREGCPEGKSWVHVPAEQPFKAISVGNNSKVWGIGRDGSAYFRNGIGPHCMTGAAWFQVEAPQGALLSRISVGKSSVFALDDSKRLWFRSEIVPVFPEGTSWKLVSENVHCVSVGPDDQVWGILETAKESKAHLFSVLARRKDVTEDNKIGTDWEYHYGPSWQHVTIRGCSNDEDSNE